MADIMLAVILGALLLFIFFAYLMIRRTVTEFKQGANRGRNGG
jgi:hypothetical protein